MRASVCCAATTPSPCARPRWTPSPRAGAEIAARLGQDVARSALIAALHVEGVASVNLVAPNADMAVPETAWAHATSVSVTVEGVSDG